MIKEIFKVVDTLNNGAITNLPNDVVVEVSSIITKRWTCSYPSRRITSSSSWINSAIKDI